MTTSSSASSAASGSTDDDDDDFRQHESRMGRIAARHFAPEHVDKALTTLAHSFVRSGLTDEQLDSLSDDDLHEQFSQLARDNPKLARQPVPPKAKPSLVAAHANAKAKSPWKY